MSELSEKVATMGFTLESTFQGVVLREGWQCFAWSVTVSRGGHEFTLDYFTGSAHRKPKSKPKDERRLKSGEISVYVDIAGGQWVSLADAVKMRRVMPIKPELADVLHSMHCPDAIDEDFAEWASSFGYSDDSIKAEKIYFECQKHERALRRMLGDEYEETMSLEH